MNGSGSSGTGTPKSVRFRREREGTWRDLQRLVDKLERQGLEGLSPEEIARLPVLYRATLSSLSVARSISLDRNLQQFLESLSLRSYLWVYGPKRSLRDSVSRFFRSSLPATFRRYWGFVAVAGGVLLLGVLTGALLVAADAEWFYSFVPPGLASGRDPSASADRLRDSLYSGDETILGGLATFAAALFSHNSMVGLLSFTLGFAVGLPVFFLMFTNGLILGAFSALFHERGLGIDWWGWVLPHGVTEMLAIVLCGAAGLVLGHALVFPGRHRRIENLALRGRDAGVLVMGAVCMLLLAGLIEGLFRQMVHDVILRYTLVAITVAFWVWYLGFAGRRKA